MNLERKFSPQYIDTLAECITGGRGVSIPNPIGFYRSGTEIVKFFRSLGYDVTYGTWSRVPFTQELLNEINHNEDGFEKITRITERLTDPRDYIGRDDKLANVVSHLNEYLKYDGLELTRTGTKYSILENGGTGPVTEMFGNTTLLLPNVKADFERALSDIDSDPEGAVTSACSTLESVAKSILDGLEKPYPRDQSIVPLVAAAMRELDIAPDRAAAIEINRVLGGLANAAAGIGVLRTRYGDAHGRGTHFAELFCFRV